MFQLPRCSLIATLGYSCPSCLSHEWMMPSRVITFSCIVITPAAMMLCAGAAMYLAFHCLPVTTALSMILFDHMSPQNESVVAKELGAVSFGFSKVHKDPEI